MRVAGFVREKQATACGLTPTPVIEVAAGADAGRAAANRPACNPRV
jgi:hypothetical protein